MGGAGGQKGNGTWPGVERWGWQRRCKRCQPLLQTGSAVVFLHLLTRPHPTAGPPAAAGPPGSVPASACLGEEAPRLLLLYLSDRRRAGHPSAASARTFMLCQGFAEEVTNLQKAGAAEEAMVAKLVQVSGWVVGVAGGRVALLI